MPRFRLVVAVDYEAEVGQDWSAEEEEAALDGLGIHEVWNAVVVDAEHVQMLVRDADDPRVSDHQLTLF